MRFRRKADETEPVLAAELSEWKIVALLGNGRDYTLTQRLHPMYDTDEMLRLCDAIANGLRNAGFPTEVTVTREQVQPR